jgi:hypothetical protein
MSVNNLYYEKYLKYKNKYINLQSQIGGYPPVFVAITDLEERTSVVPARPYQEYAYNKYFAIKEQSITREVAHKEVYEGMDITYTIKFSGEVHFDIFKDGLITYRFRIKDFKEKGMGNESFCILVNEWNVEQVLSNNKRLLEAYATEEESQRLWRIQHAQMQIDAREQKDREYREKLRQEQQEQEQERERILQMALVFVGYSENGIFKVNLARDYQEIAYKIFMNMLRGKYIESVTEIVGDMEITVFGRPPQVMFSIKKISEEEPYKFIMKKYNNDKSFSSFVTLVKEDKSENILSTDEQRLRGLIMGLNAR